MRWALSTDSNGALNLRIPVRIVSLSSRNPFDSQFFFLRCICHLKFQALAHYTRDTVGGLMGKYISYNITLDQMASQVTSGWVRITDEQGKLNQLEIYRAALGLDPLSTVDKCRLHREEMDMIDPSVCKQYDDDNTTLIIIVLSSLVGAGVVILVVYFLYKRYKAFQKIKIAHERQMESTLNEATRALRMLDYPLHLVSATDVRGREMNTELLLRRCVYNSISLHIVT